MKFITTVKNKIHKWREQRFLRKHGCVSWDMYNRLYDPDYDIRASRVKDYYHGYPYWHVFDNYNHFCYEKLADYGPGGVFYGFHRMQAWCNDSIKHKFRMDGLRLFKIENEWHINELSGGDKMVFAFENERDYAWFMLKWS